VYKNAITTCYEAVKGLLQIAGWLAIICLFTWMGWALRGGYECQSKAYKQPTIEEQVQYLESLGYDCGTPKYQAGPKFCQALNRWQCEQHFKQSIKQMANSKYAEARK